jgi:hypothetical protein
MNIDVVKIVDNEDGSANLEVEMDAEAIHFFVNRAFIQMLMDEVACSKEEVLDAQGSD